ncbi:sialate O-acetylesterase [Flavobacterium salmonis]|uniref:sialate O-acetylesterase n=1 Tax=Flavobacterium salmonis TaxID=2654844 RepID=UPI001E5F98D7|nr:sialate O-acetylesterase [Flavobacterium salmonis]
MRCIAPFKNYAIKGVLWYQGESSTKKPVEYSALMETLITNWRAEWKHKFHFYICSACKLYGA